jgi:hypothetical protein
MILTKKRLFFITVFMIFCMIMVLWGIQNHRDEVLTEERALAQSLKTQERVKGAYISMKLKEKGSDELIKVGVGLWGE